MRSWLPFHNKFFLFFLLILIILSSEISTPATPAEAVNLMEVFPDAAETTPVLREERRQIIELERDIESLKAQSGWQLLTTGSYNTGKRQKTFDISEKSNNNTELESFEKLNLGLTANRSFISGLKLDGNVNISDNEPFTTEDFSDKINFSVEGSYQVWPRVPTEVDRNLQNLKSQLELVKAEYKRAKEDFYLELLQDYLEISVLIEEKELAKSRKKLAETELQQIQDRAQIGEGSKLEIKQLQLTVKQTENNINTLKRSINTARDNYRQKLGETSEPDYDLTEQSWNKLEDIYSDPAQAIISVSDNFGKLVERKKSVSVSYARLQLELERIRREQDWTEKESQPDINFSVGSQNLSESEWQAGINLSYNLYNGGIKEIEEQKYKDEIENIKKDKEDLSFSISQQLSGQFDKLSENQEQVETAELQFENSKLELEKQQLAYEKGTVDKSQIKEQRLDKEEEKLNLIETKKRYLLRQIELVSSLNFILMEEVITKSD